MVSDGGYNYLPGAIVYLSAEKAVLHQDSIEPVFDIPTEPDPPFEAELFAYKGQDLEQSWVIEAYAVDIDTINPGTVSSVTTKKKHLLTTGDKVNIRVVSDTADLDLHAVATVTGAYSFTIPYNVSLPDQYDLAEVGKPSDLTGYTFAGQVYNYATEQKLLTFNGEFKADNGSRRVTLTSKSSTELDNLQVGDLLTCFPAGLTAVAVQARSEITPARSGYYTRAYQLASAADADVTSEQAYATRTVITQDIGTAISGAVFTFDLSQVAYGVVTASIDKSIIATLPEGQLPFKLTQSKDGSDQVLIHGVLNVA